MPKKLPWSVCQAALHGLTHGKSTEQIGRELGVAHVTVLRWARLAGMTLVRGRRGGVATVPVGIEDGDRGPVGGSYRRLTLADRSFIQAALSLPDPRSMRRIASELGVSPSTVSREVASHQVTYWGRAKYDADVAHYQARAARPRSRPGKLADLWLRAAVVTRLNAKHSPQQVAKRLRLEFPEEPEKHVSHETIYQALYVQGKGALRHELTVTKALRSGRTTRRPQSKLPRRESRPWLDGARLADRPAEAADRAVPGHWEGDLVVGPNNSGIVTLVERSTRYALIGRLPGLRDSRTVIDVMRGMIAQLPAELLRTITWDQGTEMATHATFTIETGCPVYFCDPHSPWQRGSNENLNGLVRDFYPKGTDFNQVTDEAITEMQRLLNTRPRQTLGYYTPQEKLTELITGVALAL